MSMSRVRIVAASPAHIGTIANRMRECDVIECRAMGHSPKQALRAGFIGSSLCWTATVDGRPEAMFGLVVRSALGGEGVPWMLGTEAIYQHPREMLRAAPGVLATFFNSTPRLSNLVAVSNARAIRFLRRCGFEIREEVILFAGTEFVAFSQERR
jgi:ribosomal protein S18 acetylase RimI-like enzyme